MTVPKMMYVCENCADNCPEGCGHYERGDIRKTPGGQWLCESCYDDADPQGIGLKMDDEGEWPERPFWSDLEQAPKYVFL